MQDPHASTPTTGSRSSRGASRGAATAAAANAPTYQSSASCVITFETSDSTTKVAKMPAKPIVTPRRNPSRVRRIPSSATCAAAHRNHRYAASPSRPVST